MKKKSVSTTVTQYLIDMLEKLPSPTDFHPSSNVFYSVFLSLSIFLSALLYTASFQVAQLASMEVVAPDPNVLFAHHVSQMVEGYPIEAMTPIIAKQNKTTATFLVGIAKKESNWGKRIPRAEDGTDCYNYWGYRGAGSRGIAMGHGCFGSPEEAIGIVGGRLDTFVLEYKFTTPEELVVWKCGWSCDGHSNASVKKWIADVGYYTRKLKN